MMLPSFPSLFLPGRSRIARHPDPPPPLDPLVLLPVLIDIFSLRFSDVLTWRMANPQRTDWTSRPHQLRHVKEGTSGGDPKRELWA